MMLYTLFLILISYFFGGLNAAILLCKIKGCPDPRLGGSKKPGTTNILRLHNPQAASIVFLFDLLKWVIPVYAAYFLDLSPYTIGMVGIAACLGHIFPPYFQFKGGKAVATGLGTLLPLGSDMMGLIVITWLVSIAITGYASLAAIITAIAAPFFVFFIKPLYLDPVIMQSILILIRHIGNVRRLLTGKEKKILNWRH